MLGGTLELGLGAGLPLVWTALGTAAVGLGRRFGRMTLRAHGACYLLAAALVAGLIVGGRARPRRRFARRAPALGLGRRGGRRARVGSARAASGTSGPRARACRACCWRSSPSCRLPRPRVRRQASPSASAPRAGRGNRGGRAFRGARRSRARPRLARRARTARARLARLPARGARGREAPALRRAPRAAGDARREPRALRVAADPAPAAAGRRATGPADTLAAEPPARCA